MGGIFVSDIIYSRERCCFKVAKKRRKVKMSAGFASSLFGKKSASTVDEGIDGRRLLIIEYVRGSDLLGVNKKTWKSDPYFEAVLLKKLSLGKCCSLE